MIVSAWIGPRFWQLNRFLPSLIHGATIRHMQMFRQVRASDLGSGRACQGLGRLTYLMSALRPEGFPTIATFYLADAPTLRKRISRASSALAEPLGCNLMAPAGVADAAQGSETCLRGTKFWRN